MDQISDSTHTVEKVAAIAIQNSAVKAVEEEPSLSLETVFSISSDQNESLVPVLSVKVEDSPQPRFPETQITAWYEVSRKMFANAKARFDQSEPLFESGNYFARSSYIEEFGWAVPDQKACEGIVSNTSGDILSIGSGVAAYEFGMQPMLASLERAITCSDIEHQQRTFMPVKKMSSVDAVKKFGPEHETCFFSWPAYRNPHTVRALKSRPEPFPYLVYIGEGEDGCTGDDELHEYLRQMYSCIENIYIPQWGGCSGLHDWVQIFKRK